MGQRVPDLPTPQSEEIIQRLEQELRILDHAGLLIAAAKLAEVIDSLRLEVGAEKDGHCFPQLDDHRTTAVKHSDIF